MVRFIRRRSLSLAWKIVLFSLVTASFAPSAQALHEPTMVTLGIGAKGQAASLIPLLEKRLQESRRFRVLKRISPPRQPFPWPEKDYKAWRSQTRASAALLGEASVVGNRIELTCRLIDLRKGFESKELLLSGDRRSLTDIADQAVRFLRVNYPMQAQITAAQEQRYVLDVGREDGVSEGDRFILWRLPETTRDQIAVFEIRKTDAWFSEAILLSFNEERMRSVDLQNWKGTLIEDVSSILLGHLNHERGWE